MLCREIPSVGSRKQDRDRGFCSIKVIAMVLDALNAPWNISTNVLTKIYARQIHVVKTLLQSPPVLIRAEFVDCTRSRSCCSAGRDGLAALATAVRSGAPREGSRRVLLQLSWLLGCSCTPCIVKPPSPLLQGRGLLSRQMRLAGRVPR